MWCFNVKNLNFLNHIDNLLSFIKKYKIHIEKLIKVFRDEIMLEKDDNDGYTYTRIIGGHKHKKRAYGTLKI